MTAEFGFLFLKMDESGCAKKHTAAGTYVKGEFVYAVNRCDFEGEICPRLNMQSGTGYELCQAHHAEKNLSEKVLAMGAVSDGVVWLAGHYWACEPCAASLKLIECKELRIMEVVA